MTDGNVVFPGVLDTSNATDSIILAGWVLDRPLELKKIQDAWSKLIVAWPILVSRLRRDSTTNRWQYHLPKDAASGEHARSCTTLVIPGPIHDHYNYSKPSSTVRCTMKENPLNLYCPNVASSIEEMLKEDIPLTQLQITMFDDATLLGFATPHMFCDGYGVKTIINALVRILNGEAPPPPLTMTDQFERYANAPTPLETPPYWRILSPLQTIVLVAVSFWRTLWERPIENRDVFFPKDAVAQIKSEAMSDIQQENGESSDLWISSSDALLAFCLKCTYTSAKSRTPLNVFYTANLRNIRGQTFPETFLNNAVFMVITPTLDLSTVSKMSLGALALHIRRALQVQTMPTAVDRWLAWFIGTAGRMRSFFEPSGAYNIVTNWRDMSLMDVDFSGALPDDSRGEKVKCVYMWGNGIQPMHIRNFFGIWANDPSGGVWVNAFLPKSTWENMEGFGKFIERT